MCARLATSSVLFTGFLNSLTGDHLRRSLLRNDQPKPDVMYSNIQWTKNVKLKLALRIRQRKKTWSAFLARVDASEFVKVSSLDV